LQIFLKLKITPEIKKDYRGEGGIGIQLNKND